MEKVKDNNKFSTSVSLNDETIDAKLESYQEKSDQILQKKSRNTEKFRAIYIYKFADKLDIFLLSIGTISSLASGACFPLLLYIYQEVTDALVDYGKLQYIEQTSQQNLSRISCESAGFSIPNNTTSPIQAIGNVVKWYVLLGSLSILFYTIGFSTYMVSAERQIRRIRFRLFKNILYQDMSYFDVLAGKGRLTNMLGDDLLKIKEGIGDKVADFLSLLARMVGCLIFALVKGWKLTLVILAIAPLVVIAFNLTITFTVKYTKKQILAYAEANSIAQEVLTAIRTVTAFGAQKNEYDRYNRSLSKLPGIGLKKGLIQGLCQMFSNVSTGIVFTGALWYGQYLIKTECQTYSTGVLVVIFIACLNTTWCVNQIVPSLNSFADATASGSLIFETLLKKSKIDASKVNEGAKPKSLIGEIVFENVSFYYPSRPKEQVLNNLNMTIPNGKRVALVGHSGCGKSTTISLIPRMYDPYSGQVLLDGQDIRNLNIKWLRENIGYVGQEPVLFSGSIKENIAFGKENATESDIYQAAEIANAHDFISNLPDNYNSSALGKLSGGQKQCIAIARAIISNPKILILDEATSALDNENEKLVQQALNKASEGRTTIIIAHRLTTIRHADLILVFDKGTIVEQGTHDELIALELGIYHKLVTQNRSEDIDKDCDTSDNDSILPQFKSNMSLEEISVTHDEINDRKEHDHPERRKKSWLHTPLFIKLLKLSFPERFYLIVGCICALLYGSVEPIVGFVYSIIYGLLANPNLDDQSFRTRNLALSILGVYVIAGVLQFLSTIVFTKAGEAFTLRIRLSTFETILRREISWFDKTENSVGSLLTRLSSDTTTLKALTGTLLNAFFSSLGAASIALIFGFMAGWKLTLIVLCFTPLLVLTGYLQGQTQSKAGQSKTAKSYAEEGGNYAVEAIEKIRTVSIFHLEEMFINRYQNAFNKDFKSRIPKIQIQALGKAIANSFLYFIHVATFSYGAILVESGEMSFDQVFRVFIVINFASMSIGRSTSIMPDNNRAKAAAQRILELHERKSAIDPYDSDGIQLNNFQGNIEFRGIDFSYPSNKIDTVKLILNKFNLTCLAGETTALVGSSGCGKSTLISLLLRFYDPTNGQILLGGHEIRTINVNSLRSFIGFVQQEPMLFNRTIYENIAYGVNDQQISFEEIQEAAKQANIHDSIIKFANGYDTYCGSTGNTQLSGGEKQRIAIARALLRKPKILLLDEATSALDNKSQKTVQEAIDRARANRTCLSIAHRLTTIERSEKIAVVNRGHVQEEGRHEDLLSRKGLYYKLYTAPEIPNE